MHAPIRNTLAAALIAMTVAAPAHAGGQVSFDFKPANAEFIDGVEYDGRQPNTYLRQFPIGLKNDDDAS